LKSSLLVVIEEESVFSGYDESKQRISRHARRANTRGKLSSRKSIDEDTSPGNRNDVELFQFDFSEGRRSRNNEFEWRKFARRMADSLQCQNASSRELFFLRGSRPRFRMEERERFSFAILDYRIFRLNFSINRDGNSKQQEGFPFPPILPSMH